jgi:DNA polymerase elongation subunit (family B)
MSDDILNSNFVNAYKIDLLDRLAMVGIDSEMIDDDKVNQMILSNFDQSEEVTVFNNVKEIEYSTSLLSLVNMLLFSKRKPIFTGYNTIFDNHTRAENPPGDFLEFLGDSRNLAKKEMHKHQNDPDPVIYNDKDREQKVYKLFGVSYYGAFGQKAFHFFNTLLGPSTTAQGRQLISASILGFEGFLGDNMEFYEFGELVRFLQNIINEETIEDFTLDVNFQITDELIIDRFKSKCTFVFTDTELGYLEGVVANSEGNESLRQKLYFKNNLFQFLAIDEIKHLIAENLDVENFYDVNKPPVEIKDSLDGIFELMRYFVAYPYPYNTKTVHASEMTRNTVLICDTDSNFVYVYRWLCYFCDLLGLDVTKISKSTRASKVSPMTYFMTKYITEVFDILNLNSNVPEDKLHLISMKSEFHLARVILTKNKKSYAALILSKEGNLYNEAKFDVKGIPIKKTSTPKPARIFYSELLEEKMLKAEVIDVQNIYKESCSSKQDSL